MGGDFRVFGDINGICILFTLLNVFSMLIYSEFWCGMGIVFSFILKICTYGIDITIYNPICMHIPTNTHQLPKIDKNNHTILYLHICNA